MDLVQMLHDFRYAFRTLRQNPGFALTAIISIALGIGANAVVFSMADGLLLRPLPVPDPAQVVTLKSRTPSGTFGSLSYADFADFRDRDSSFDGLAAYDMVPFGFAADAKAQPQLKVGFLVSGNFFRVLRTEPQLGRGFRAGEDLVPGRDAVIVLGYDFWNTEFGADRSVIGRSVRLNGVDFTVIGVAPKSFTGIDQFVRPAFFVPAMMAPTVLDSGHALLTDRKNRSFSVKGRLKRGVSLHAADAAAAAFAKSLEQSHPDTNQAFGAGVLTEIQARMDFDVGDAILLKLLSSLVVVVLLIACANVANLLLSRGRARSREIAIRLAIGASRPRLVRQLLAESLLIALAGSGLGLIVTEFAVDIISTIQVPGDIPVQLTFLVDHRVVWFTLLLSVFTAILFGLGPALQSTRTNLVSALKAGEQDRARRRFSGRNALVIAQVAGALLLLVAATQLYRGFSYLLAQSPGFRTDHLVMLSVDPALVRYTPARTEQFYRTLTERARTVPGVRSVALTSSIPMSTNMQPETVIPEGYQFPRGKESDLVLTATVDPGFFRTFDVPMQRGRGFVPGDRSDSPRVAVVNEAFARHYTTGDPIGKRLRLNDRNGPVLEIVGVTATGKYVSIVEPPADFVYLPLAQQPRTRMTLLAWTWADPASFAGAMRQVVRSIDPNVPVFGVRTMDDFFEQRSVEIVHLISGIVGAAGLVGLCLALVGLYAVVAYQVARRTREIGIRMAIGADRPQVMRMILKQAGGLGAAGVLIGSILCFAAGRALTAGIGMPAFDPLLFALVPAGLLLTTLLAAAVPVRRAAQVDPMVALRQD